MPNSKSTQDINLSPKVSEKSERVVVDEIFEDGSVRLLRAPRLINQPDDDLSIETWGEEREEFLDARRVEAFVGFPSQRHLVEGDVFFIADRSKLHKKYKPIDRDRARKEHLLKDFDESKQIARDEIKKQFYKLFAIQITDKKREIKSLIKKVDKKFETEI